MNKSTTYLLIFLFIILFIITGYRYKEYVRDKNFTLEVNTVCDINNEKCFVSDCSADDSECDTTPYKKVEILANQAPKCLEEHNCSSFSCESRKKCSVTYCNVNSIENGEKCATQVLINE